MSSPIKATKVDIAQSLTDAGNGQVIATEETLKEMVTHFRGYLDKVRNIPAKGTRSYPQFEINALQYVANIIQATQAMIEQNVIQSDPYGFLTGTVKSFSKTTNMIINTQLIPKANAIIAKKHADNLAKQEAQGKEVSTEEKELNPTQVAAIASEPTEDPNTYVIEILTTTGKRWYFDKVNFTLSYMKKDGELKVIKLAKKGSWRASVINTFVKCISWIKEKYNTAKDRCIGIKQTIQFKWLQAKFNAEQKLKAKQQLKQDNKKSDDDDSVFKDLPANPL